MNRSRIGGAVPHRQLVVPNPELVVALVDRNVPRVGFPFIMAGLPLMQIQFQFAQLMKLKPLAKDGLGTCPFLSPAATTP